MADTKKRQGIHRRQLLGAGTFGVLTLAGAGKAEAARGDTFTVGHPITGGAVLNPNSTAHPARIVVDRVVTVGRHCLRADENLIDNLANILGDSTFRYRGVNYRSGDRLDRLASVIMDERAVYTGRDEVAAAQNRQRYVNAGIQEAATIDPAAFSLRQHASVVKAHTLYCFDKLVQMGLASYEEEFAMPAKARWMHGDAVFMGGRIGQVRPMSEYIHSMMYDSGCDAAQTILEYMGKKLRDNNYYQNGEARDGLRAMGMDPQPLTDDWVYHWTGIYFMMQCAREIGMLQTTIYNPHGMRSGQTWTAPPARRRVSAFRSHMENETCLLDQLLLAQAIPERALQWFRPLRQVELPLDTAYEKTGYNRQALFNFLMRGTATQTEGGAPLSVPVSTATLGAMSDDARASAIQLGYEMVFPEVQAQFASLSDTVINRDGERVVQVARPLGMPLPPADRVQPPR
ncbi:MAG: hypothetical protein AB7G06_03295 [Bdellovibrionales bacterium]